jgi:hypothetical protein
VSPRVVGFVLAVLTTVLVVANQEHVGLARDELVYMQHGERYAKWWRGAVLGADTSTERITKTWGGPNPTDNNREHPPLIKTLSGFSKMLLHDGLGVDELTAYRFPSALLHGLLVLLVFLMVLELFGFAEAVLSGLLVMLLPRALFHAGLACFDGPIMTMWFAVIFAYWRAMDGRKWPWLVGVVFGLALATKHNALLLPIALGLHYLVVGIRARGAAFLLHRWRVILSMLLLAPLTFIALWPWLWFDTYAHVRDWLTFHLTHVHYNFEYLGENWNAPPFPWHVALVTTLFTVPVATLVAAVLGAGTWFARRKQLDARMPGLLLLLSAAASIGPFMLGSTPIFGAEKHWMPALPTICIFAGVGTVWAARALGSLIPAGGSTNHGIRRAILAVTFVAVVGASLVETITAQPYALTWYNAAAGEAPGGADRGMNRQFWGVAARGVLPVLAKEATKKKTPVYTHDASPAWGTYLKRGEVPSTMPDAGHEEAGIHNSQYALVVHEKHFNRHDYLVWKIYGTVQPMFVLRSHGVPIVTLYKRPLPRPNAEKPPGK